MIDIQNITQSEIIQSPWPHQVIDNFFDDITFQELQSISNKISTINDYDTSEIIWLNELEALQISSKVTEKILDCADILIKNFDTISKPYDSFRQKSNLGYFNIPRLGISPPNIINEIHDEGTNKIMALIVYLSPNENIGTLLYSKNEESSFSKEIEWLPNRAFLMFSSPGITWHKFNSSNEKRLTLNFYFEKLEALQHLSKNISRDKLFWIYDILGKGKLITEKL